nr:type II toxin-antitoxin system VapB family antitoxin [uncultured Sphingomonas sp.]
MASLYIKDPDTAALAAEVAAALGTTKTEAVRDSLLRRKAELEAKGRAQHVLRKLDAHRRAHPLPPPTGQPADKAFFDELWGEA